MSKKKPRRKKKPMRWQLKRAQSLAIEQSVLLRVGTHP
jgi:hypothetical protein